MNAVLRHLSVRLWVTAFGGTMACIALLPWWQQVLGVDWLTLPASLIMAGCFIGAGWMMNRIGMLFLQRHVNEAAVWERAGMPAEALSACRKAMAAFDSFWLSPLLRRAKLRWFSTLMARFYMGQHSDSSYARSLLAHHLKTYPDDAVVAEPWLEQLLAVEYHLPEEHEAAVRISSQLNDNWRIQRLLMQFYMANGRVDFDAMQAYRRVWNEQQPLPQDTVRNLTRLLLNEYVLSPWALQVYLKAYAGGDRKALEGIAAAVRWLPPTEESRTHLVEAKKIMAATAKGMAPSMNPRFKPTQVGPSPKDTSQFKAPARSDAKLVVNRFIKALKIKGNRSTDRLVSMLSALPRRQVLPVAAVVMIAVLVAVAGLRFFQRPAEAPVQQEPVPEKVVITDPFTIQVAAYLKPGDAQRLVDRLIENQLDAFWTKASSASRTWYQVKVSHFPTREAAQQYGQTLKTKGLIDDFYVANYEHDSRATKP